jgi:hypothetical protein
MIRALAFADVPFTSPNAPSGEKSPFASAGARTLPPPDDRIRHPELEET